VKHQPLAEVRKRVRRPINIGHLTMSSKTQGQDRSGNDACFSKFFHFIGFP
jgi:hypothetical protein